MLHYPTCVKCMREFGTVSETYDDNDRLKSWGCWLLINRNDPLRRFSRKLDIKSVPPIGCPYALEHAMHAGRSVDGTEVGDAG